MFSSVTSRVSSLKQWIFMYSNGKMTAESHSCNHQGCSHNSKAYSEPIPMRSLCQHQPLYEKSIFPCWCLTFCYTENILWCTESKERSICGTKQDRIFCCVFFFFSHIFPFPIHPCQSLCLLLIRSNTWCCRWGLTGVLYKVVDALLSQHQQRIKQIQNTRIV